MPKVTGSVTLYFEDIEFEDDGDLSLRDQAVEALSGAPFGEGDVADVRVDEIDGEAV